MAAATQHSHDGLGTHSHGFNAAEHGHSHEILDGPGSYAAREMPLTAGRDWNERAFTVGIGANKKTSFRTRPVGSGKTALMLKLCLALRDEYSIAAVTNDIFTRQVPTRANPPTSRPAKTPSSSPRTPPSRRTASPPSRRAGARTPRSARTSAPTCTPCSPCTRPSPRTSCSSRAGGITWPRTTRGSWRILSST
ncbi:MAG: hypothetical protein Q9167_005980 [Letrouitia subvulpina]